MRRLSVAIAALATVTIAVGPSLPARAATAATSARGVSIVDAKEMIQADGSTSQTWTVRFVEENLEGPFKGETWGGTCSGMGLVTSDGTYSGVSRCSVTVSADDGYTFELKDTAEGGDWVITGGKGRFAGIAGNGHTTYTWGDAVFGDKIGWTSQGSMSMP